MRVLMTTKCTSRVSAALVVVCCVALIGLGGNAQASLVGWWNLDDGLADNTTTTAADSSPTPAGGSANDGVLQNYPDPTLNWNQGLTGASDGITMPHGLKFDGGPNQSVGDTPASQHVDLNAHVADFSAMTQGSISLWFRHDKGLSSDHAMFGMANDADNSMARLQFEVTPSGDRVIRATERVVDDTEDLDVPITDDGNWHNIIWTSDGANSKVYVDGVLGATGTQGFLSTIPSADFLSLGFTNRQARPLWYYLGTMGDVRIYDNVLSQAQARYVANPQNYGDGLALPEPASAALLLLGSVAIVSLRRRSK